MRDTTHAERGDLQSAGYRWYVVLVLCLAYIVAFIDRQVVSMLVAPIKGEFDLSDFQIGLLQGPAFGIFYTVMGLPLGWLSDRFNRPVIISSALAVWSAMTALSAAAGSFAHLFAARIGVGIGEAALQPSALSLIGEYFPPDERPAAVSVFVSSGMIGAGIAFTFAGSIIGYIGSHPNFTIPLMGSMAGWRAVFVIAGIPGLVVASLCMSIREPRVRISSTSTSARQRHTETICQSLDARLGWHIAAIAFFSIATYALLAWLPTYFLRVWGWSPRDFGVVYGPLFATFGVIGGILGGRIAARLRTAGALDAVPRIVAIGLTIAPLSLVAGFMMPNARSAVFTFGTAAFMMGFPIGIAPSLIHELCPASVQGRIIAVYYLIVSLVGISCGAPLVGFLTDHVFKGQLLIGHSLALVILSAGALSACSSWMCWRQVRNRLRLICA